MTKQKPKERVACEVIRSESAVHVLCTRCRKMQAAEGGGDEAVLAAFDRLGRACEEGRGLQHVDARFCPKPKTGGGWSWEPGEKK